MQNNSKIFNGTGRVVKDSTGALKQVDDTYKLATGETEEVNGGFVASSGAISTTGTYTVSAVAEDDADDLLTEAKYLGIEFGTLGAKDVSVCIKVKSNTDNLFTPTGLPSFLQALRFNKSSLKIIDPVCIASGVL